MQALRVLKQVRGTPDVDLEYDDITAASSIAAQVMAVCSPSYYWQPAHVIHSFDSLVSLDFH
jgi:hypothetical protein